jgi:hypothetical protein
MIGSTCRLGDGVILGKQRRTVAKTNRDSKSDGYGIDCVIWDG